MLARAVMEVSMKDLLSAVRGARVIARGVDNGRKIIHYLLDDGRVLEVVR
jgi:hypothetical protein